MYLPSGDHVDNCQHVTLGCCTNLADFINAPVPAEKLNFYDRLIFSSPDGQRGEMHSSWLLAPLHISPLLRNISTFELGG